ncbi:MAG: SCO family protein, partial [Pseudomonadales bacterium]
MDDNQKKGVTKTLLGLAAFIALVLGLLVASIILPRGLTEEQARALGYYRFDTPRAIPAFSLTDHHGNQVGLDKLQGQSSMLFFGFTTCPDICPTTLSVLAESVKGVAEHPQIIMVSVDPERDTPEKLSAYVPAFNPDFTGYTGSFDET